jgi:hypothetical protein
MSFHLLKTCSVSPLPRFDSGGIAENFGSLQQLEKLTDRAVRARLASPLANNHQRRYGHECYIATETISQANGNDQGKYERHRRPKEGAVELFSSPETPQS